MHGSNHKEGNCTISHTHKTRLHFNPVHSYLKYWLIKKSLCTWWSQYRKLQVTSSLSPASLQTFIDTPNCVLEDRVQYSTVRIPYVFCYPKFQLHYHGKRLKLFKIFLHVFCTVIIRCTETFGQLLVTNKGKSAFPAQTIAQVNSKL
jgi:hypothetical protein